MEVNERVGKQNSTVDFTDDAVGVGKSDVLSPKETEIAEGLKKNNEEEEKHWYIGIVPPRHEKMVAERIQKLGYEVFVPIQTVTRTWSQGRKRKVDVVLIPAKIFIFTTNRERLSLLNYHLGIKYYLVNISGGSNLYGARPIAEIPQKQIKQFQLMLNYSPNPIDVVENSFVKGDKIRIVSGPLKGLEGIVKRDSENKTRVYIVLDMFGSASTEIEANRIEVIN